MKKIFFTVIFISLFNCKDSYSQNEKQIDNVSIIELISNPENYHDKKVRVKGYFKLEREGNAIYLHKADYDNSIFQNGIYLYITKKDLEDNLVNEPYEGYMSIVGRFNKDDGGHKNLYNGSMIDIEIIRRIGRSIEN